MITWSLLYYLSEWVVRLVMLVVVTRRHRPASAMAWLLVIFFIPWPGAVLYWLIGSNRLPRRRILAHRHMQQRLSAVAQRIAAHPSVVHPELGPDAAAAVKLAERLGAMPILGGNHVDLIADTDQMIDRLVADIDAAEDHVHLLFYIYANDDTGRRVAAALIRAAERGVTCRLLVDAVGSRRMLKELAPELTRRGVQVHAALPVGLFRRRMARIDLRNHRKIAVIDGRVGYTGSQNIVSASYGTHDLVWEDLMLVITGPGVLELQAVFVSDWYFESNEMLDRDHLFPQPELVGNVPIQVIPGGPGGELEAEGEDADGSGPKGKAAADGAARSGEPTSVKQAPSSDEHNTGRFPSPRRRRKNDSRRAYPRPSRKEMAAAAVEPTPRNNTTENFQRLVVAALYTARHSVCFTTPYFVPDEPLIQALQVAVMRGVDVELIIPRRSDQRLVAAASRAYYEEMLQSDVKLFRYEPGLLHAKTLCIDDRFALVGSSNLDIRSFELNFEINVLLYDGEVAERLRRQQAVYRAASRRLTLEQWRARPAWKRLRDNIAKLLSPLL